MKRFLSLLLTVAMVFSCVSFTALAEDGEAAAVTFELYGSTNVATQAYAHAGSKVMLTAVEGATYKKNGAAYNAVAGPVAGTVLFDVSAGSNIFTAVVGDVEYNVPFYGVSAFSKGSVANLATTNLGTEVTEGAFIDDAHTVAYAVRAEKFYQDADAGYTLDNGPKDVIVSGKNQAGSSKSGDNNNVYSYGFYFDGALTAPFNVMDIMGGQYSNSAQQPATWNGKSKKAGTALITISTENEVVVYDWEDSPIYTGVKVAPNVWHDVALTSNIDNEHYANVYIDGVLVAKVPFVRTANSTTTTNRADQYRGPVLFVPSGPSNAYVGASSNIIDLGGGDRTIFEIYDGAVTFPATPAIAQVMDGETPVANTVAVTYEPALDIADYEIKVFVNGTEAETMLTAEGYYILVDEAVPAAQVQIKVVDANGNVAYDHKSTALESNVIEMDLEVPTNTNKVFEPVYQYSINEGNTYAHVGSYVVAKAVLGATYYNNGVEITDFLVDMDAGTVSLPVVADYNNFTAIRGGKKLGYISVYGVGYDSTSRIGANLATATDSFKLTAESSKIDGRTAYKIGAQTTYYKGFSSDTTKNSGSTVRKHVGVGYAFYMAARSESDFVIANFTNTTTIASANKIKFKLYVTPAGDLKFVDFYGNDRDTGFDVAPGQWYEFNAGVDTSTSNKSAMLNIYINRQLVARANMFDPTVGMSGTMYIHPPTGDGTNTYVGPLASADEILASHKTSTGVPIVNSGKTYFYAQRNGDFANRTTEKFTATDVSGSTVTATGVTSFLDRAVYFDGTLVYTNGATVANDKGITVTAEGDSFTIASSKASYTDADVEIYAVDPMGCKVNGMYGALKTTAKVSVESSYREPTVGVPVQVEGAFNTFTVPAPDFTGVTDPALLGHTSALFIDGVKAQGTQTEQGFVVESATARTATAFTALVDAEGNIVNGLGGPIKSEEVEITLYDSSIVNNSTFAVKHAAATGTSAYAYVGSNIVAKPVAGATYKLNGTEVALTPDFTTGTVKLPVNAGLNIYTAEKDGAECGKIAVYGVSFARTTNTSSASGNLTARKQGQNLNNAKTFNFTTSASVGGRTGYLVPATVADTSLDFAFGEMTTGGSTANPRDHVGYGYAFYIGALPTADFTVFSLNNADVLNFQLYVDTQGKLWYRDYANNVVYTGIDITPGEWYEFNAGMDLVDNNEITIYINRDLVARAPIYKAGMSKPDTITIKVPTGDGTNTYVGELKTNDDILTSPRRSGNYGVYDGSAHALRFYAQRNGDYLVRPAMTATVSGNTITVTETDMTDYAAYTGRKVLVNGKEPAELGITVTAEGNVYTFSSLVTVADVKVEIFVTDAEGNNAPGLNGTLKATVTVDVEGSIKFGLYGSVDVENQYYAHAGSKVMLTAVAGGVYYRNGELYNPEEGPDNTVLFEVAPGYNTFSVITEGVTIDIPFYGAKTLKSYAVYDLETDNDYDVLSLTKVEEGAFVDDDAHTYAYAVSPSRYTNDGTKEDYSAHVVDRSFTYTRTLSEKKEYTNLVYTYGFYIDGALEAPFNVMDILGAHTNGGDILSQTWTGTSYLGHGTLLVTIATTGEVVITQPQYNSSTKKYDLVPMNTGYFVESNMWHDIAVTSNFYNNDKANVYIDGVLVAKATFNPSTVGRYDGPMLMVPSGPANAYVGAATNPGAFGVGTSTMLGNCSDIFFPEVPTVEQTTKEVEEAVVLVDNTITPSYINVYDIVGYTMKVFVNGEAVEAKISNDNFVIQSDKAIDNATVYVAVVDEQGNFAKDLAGADLKSAAITMNIVANDLPAAVTMDADRNITVNRELLGDDAAAQLAIVSVDANDEVNIELLDAEMSEATAPTGAVKVFVWIWETLKPLVENLIK